MSTYTGTSIVDYLKSVGQASDYATRKTLATSKGISNYSGTAEQNTQLLNMLRTPAPAPAPAPVYAPVIKSPAPATAPAPTPAPKPTPAPTPAPTTILKQGTGSSVAPDPTVKAIQTQLGITADGIFGPQTKSAIMAFQQANGLTVDGIVGPQTQAALARAVSGTSAPTSTPANFDANTSSTYTVKAGDKYNPYTGEALSNVAPGTVINKPSASPTNTDPASAISAINTDANTDQDKLFSSLSESLGTSVDVSNSEKLIKSLTESLANITNPVENTPSLTQQLADKRASLGVDAKETQLNTIDAQIAKLDSDFSSLADTETNRPTSMMQINRRKSQEQINYEKAKNDLILQRNSVANELNQKYAVINTYMQYAGQDYNNAQQNYATKFNQAITMINLAKNIEESAKSDAERAQDNARANATLLINALKDKKTNYSSLDPATQASMNKMELQAGLPTGFIKFTLSATDQPVISIGSEFTDASGHRQVPVYNKDPSTGMVTAKVITIGTDQKTVDNNANTAKNQANDIATAILDFQKAIKEMKWRGIDPTMYENYKEQILKQYGSAAVLKFDKAIADAKLVVDYGASSDSLFNKREI